MSKKFWPNEKTLPNPDPEHFSWYVFRGRNYRLFKVITHTSPTNKVRFASGPPLLHVEVRRHDFFVVRSNDDYHKELGSYHSLVTLSQEVLRVVTLERLLG